MLSYGAFHPTRMTYVSSHFSHDNFFTFLDCKDERQSKRRV
ncbi:hypothetical protein HanPI659440_Chr17g0684071 [Helianthus annuus]|nr:hypothetical protein HanPI659440_Chr17g0684071 [Helianthus annuus]